MDIEIWSDIACPWCFIGKRRFEKALEQFRLIEQQYPESQFSGLAHDRIEVCREMLARNELLIGTYYQKRANYRAAESRMAELMEKYPDTPVAPDALYNLGVTLEKEGKKYSAAQAQARRIMRSGTAIVRNATNGTHKILSTATTTPMVSQPSQFSQPMLYSRF